MLVDGDERDEKRSWLGHLCQLRNDEDINRSSGPGEREAGKVKKSLKGKGTCPGFYVGIHIDAVSTTKSEMKGVGEGDGP